jgi:hypothetical protein
MNQILHIFLKDMRRFWAEIFISVAITVVFVGVGAYLSMGVDDLRVQTLSILVSLLMTLVPVSWWVLIARVIHAERLVGDTQYWITRPYVWSNLLAAKLLFLAVFVYLPFFIAQGLLLAEAGFAPQRLRSRAALQPAAFDGHRGAAARRHRHCHLKLCSDDTHAARNFPGVHCFRHAVRTLLRHSWQRGHK